MSADDRMTPGRSNYGKTKAVVLLAHQNGWTIDEAVAHSGRPRASLFYCSYRLGLPFRCLKPRAKWGSVKDCLIKASEQGLTYAQASELYNISRTSLYDAAKQLNLSLKSSKHKK
jgi:hypothetical protein